MFVKHSKPLYLVSLATLAACMSHVPVSQAFNFGNIMNPSRWMGGDRYDDPYYDDPYYGGPYGDPYLGYGYPGAYGAPYGAPYGMPGFGAPPLGYGAPGYPGGAPAVAPAAPPAPAKSNSADREEVEALKRRIEQLEAKQYQQRQTAPASEWPSAPAFRPMNQY